jgi:hypothetical protein
VPLVLNLACLVIAGRAASKPVAGLVRLLLILALAFLLPYLLQQKGWTYQFVPVLGFSVLGGTVLCAALLQDELLPVLKRALDNVGRGRFRAALRSSFGYIFSLRGISRGMAAGIAALLPLSLVYFCLLQFVFAWDYGPATQRLTATLRTEEERSLFNLATSMNPAILSVTLARGSWSFTQPHLWALPIHYQARRHDGVVPELRAPDEQSADEAAHFRHVIETFLARRPKFVTVYSKDLPPLALEDRTFDFLAYFRQDRDFAAAWRSYELHSVIGSYALFIRSERASTPELSQ